MATFAVLVNYHDCLLILVMIASQKTKQALKPNLSAKNLNIWEQMHQMDMKIGTKDQMQEPTERLQIANSLEVVQNNLQT